MALPNLLPRFGAPMKFSPVEIDENDELGRDIAQDSLNHDNGWRLEEYPDEEELEAFWSNVQDDVANDPKWFTFANDEE